MNATEAHEAFMRVIAKLPKKVIPELFADCNDIDLFIIAMKRKGN